MKKVFVLVLLVTLSMSVSAQDERVRTTALNKIVEFLVSRGGEAADFSTISVYFDGKLMKQFPSSTAVFPNIVAMYNGFDGDYILYRTFMGNGGCAGGEIFVLKFYTYGARYENVGLLVSPALKGCLGENPPVEFSFDKKLQTVIRLSDKRIRGETLSQWESVGARAPVKRR
ncbi:MAG TPA: hypothetical protein VK582_00620 [Pyrinomonadaceae bacterium]|nr:hypothetical protein [Pyrinomonadaceae bacterium]